MKLPYPRELYPDLSSDRLEQIAIKLLDVRHTTSTDMNSPHDCNYTRESAIFGRSRNAIIEMAQYCPWLSIMHAGMDITFAIGDIPCRFFTDDPNNPQKDGFFKQNAVDNLNPDLFPDSLTPIVHEPKLMFRFIVEKGITDDDEARVVFAIFDGNTCEKISEWIHETSIRVAHPVNERDAPTGIEIPPVSVDVLEDDDLDIASHE